MNWYILAGVLLSACVACVLCYYTGVKNGATVELEEESEAAYERGYETAKNEEAALLQNKVEVAFHNGRTKGFQLGVDHQNASTPTAFVMLRVVTVRVGLRVKQNKC